MFTKHDPNGPVPSKREQVRTEMLRAAMERPGVHEVMQVYGGWRERDQGLDVYRSATKTSKKIVTTTNSS